MAANLEGSLQGDFAREQELKLELAEYAEDVESKPVSLTQRLANWATGLQSLERGDPLPIPTSGLRQLTRSIQKATCLHLRNDKCLSPHQPSPMLLFANPARMTPLIRGLPD